MKKIAITGCAHIHTPNFVKLILTHPGISAAGVWDPDPERAAGTAAALGCPVVPAAEQIWNDPAIDAVVVCSETCRHAELIRAAAAAGKHIFAEKPLGFDTASAYATAREVTAAGVIFQTGYFNRGRAVHRWIKAQVEAGTFGRITRVRHSNCHSGSLGGWFDTQWRWLTDPAQAGCGAFGDMGTHSLDILMWIFGRPDRVSAEITPVTGRYGECDETGEALLRFPGGVIGSLAAGWVDIANPQSMMVSGTEGCAWINAGELFVKSEKLGSDGRTPWRDLPEDLPHAFVLFLDALCGRAVPLVSPGEAADRNAVMEAAYRSARSGRRETPLYCD